jgi:hypothetical protein
MENVLQRLLNDLPKLQNDAGDPLGVVRIRYLVIEAGKEEKMEEVLKNLESKSYISSPGTQQEF